MATAAAIPHSEGASKQIRIVGVPLDLGANMRGANMGPAAVRIAHIHDKIRHLGHAVVDDGDIFVEVRERIAREVRDINYLPLIVKVCAELAARTEQAVSKGDIPMTIGGDHSIAIGSIGGAIRAYRKRQEKMGLIWFDAHADINAPDTSPSGNIHGMPLAVLLGRGFPELVEIAADGEGVRPQNVCLVGVRSIDDDERKICRDFNIHCFTMREIDERGMLAVMKDAISAASKGTEGIYVSFDLDGIDPQYAPGVSTPVTGGLSYREAHLALELIAETRKLAGLDLVELNPMTDIDHKTAHLAVELAQSALGKSII